MGATKPKHHHSDRDRIWTPENLAQLCISKVPFNKETDRLCDPCYGEGIFFNNFNVPSDNKTWFEIDL